MYNSSKLRSIWENYNNYILLAILITITSIITYYRVLIQIDIGPLSDSCDFLSNAYVFAGHQSCFDSSRPPFFSFLLSLLFMIGFTSTNTIFVLDGLMFVSGVIGMFLLLNIRFNATQSFLGSLLYATFPIIITVMGTGFSDLASVSITIWAFYFLVLAIKKDSKFFYLVFPFAMLAFLTRYNNALIIFPILLYILINKEKIKNFKSMLIGIFTSLVFLIPVILFFNQKFGGIFYSFSSSYKMTSNVDLSGHTSFDPNLLFFVEKFPSFIGPDGIFALLIIILGLFIVFFLKFKQKSERNPFKLKIEKNSLKPKLIFFCILILLFIITFNKVHYVFSEILFFILSYQLYIILKNFNIKDLDLHLLFLTWFMVFFTFHSIFEVKVNRYFVIMAPPVAYFLILGLSEISDRIHIKINKNNLTFPILTVILTSIIILSTASIIPDIGQSNEIYKVNNEIMNSASEWFINHDPDYKNKIIYSDMVSYSGWYLKTDVKCTSLLRTQRYGLTYDQILENNNVDYYFSIKELNLTSYKPIKQFGNLIIYKKN